MQFDEAQNALQHALRTNQITEQDTAVIIYAIDRLYRMLDKLSGAFPGQQSVAMKTCPIPAVLRHIVDAGCALEAASIEEVRLAFSKDVRATNVIFDSPVKTRAEINEVAAHEGVLLNANTLAELGRIPADAKCRVGLRVNPLIDTTGPQTFQVSTGDSKFGVPIEQKTGIIEACLKYPFISALHMHIGSGLSTYKDHVEAVRKLVAVADEINTRRQDKGWPAISLLDIGGGLKSTLNWDDDCALLKNYSTALGNISGLFNRYDVVTEFGQLIHATNGLVASRAEYVRELAGLQQVFVHVGADLFARKVYADLGPAFSYNVLDKGGKAKSSQVRKSQIVGPLCFAGDVLEEAIALPEVIEGDWLLISNSIANSYGLWSRHCSRDMPKVLIYSATTQETTTAHERKQVW